MSIFAQKMEDLDHNPFVIKGYFSKELFCDRENELEELYINIKSNSDTTLIAPRRMGKTGLIFRFFDYIEERDENITGIYIDIFATRSLADFINFLTEAIMSKYGSTTWQGSKFLELIKGLRPMMSYSAITGEPQIQITYQNRQEKEYTLKGLLEFLDAQNERIVLAIDEFQQIVNYPEDNVEALLRTYIQHLHNISFIFCGSRKRMMLNMFSNAKRPFFATTRYLYLNKIDREKYRTFIKDIFESYSYLIDDSSLDFILDWTKIHTFYTQSVCNKVFSLTSQSKKVDLALVKQACLQILQQSEPVFLQYRQLLTSAQWNYLIAVAKEGEIKKITSQAFIAKHNIGTPANSRRISKSLEEKELLLEEVDKKETTYSVYDLFLSRWLEMTY